MRENGVKEQVVGNRNGEKRSNPGYTLKVEVTDFLSNQVGGRWKRKRRSKISGLIKQKDGVAIK